MIILQNLFNCLWSVTIIKKKYFLLKYFSRKNKLEDLTETYISTASMLEGRIRVKSSVKGLKGSICAMTRARVVVKQWHSERFARKRRVGQFVGQFLKKIVRSLSSESCVSCADSSFIQFYCSFCRFSNFLPTFVLLSYFFISTSF